MFPPNKAAEPDISMMTDRRTLGSAKRNGDKNKQLQMPPPSTFSSRPNFMRMTFQNENQRITLTAAPEAGLSQREVAELTMIQTGG